MYSPQSAQALTKESCNCTAAEKALCASSDFPILFTKKNYYLNNNIITLKIK